MIDLVAHTRVKTPTAAAEFLIDALNVVMDKLEVLAARLQEGARNRLLNERQRLATYKSRIPASAYRRISDTKLALLTAQKDMARAVTASLARHRHRLELLQQRLADASPEKLLARGYSITLKDGKVLKDLSAVKAGDELVTCFHQGKLTSVVNIVEPKTTV